MPTHSSVPTTLAVTSSTAPGTSAPRVLHRRLRPRHPRRRPRLRRPGRPHRHRPRFLPRCPATCRNGRRRRHQRHRRSRPRPHPRSRRLSLHHLLRRLSRRPAMSSTTALPPRPSARSSQLPPAWPVPPACSSCWGSRRSPGARSERELTATAAPMCSCSLAVQHLHSTSTRPRRSCKMYVECISKRNRNLLYSHATSTSVYNYDWPTVQWHGDGTSWRLSLSSRPLALATARRSCRLEPAGCSTCRERQLQAG